MIIPSIDLMNGKAVQLQQGKKKILEVDNPIELAKEFRKYGDIAVIDLDAALSKGNNFSLIKKICKIADCRVGGGVRTKEKAIELIKAGAKKIIIGTKADIKFLKQLPKDKIIIAIDTKKKKIFDKGWIRDTRKDPLKVIKQLEPYCSGFLCTIIDKEGLLKGTDLDYIKKIKKITKNRITAAGGISSIDEIKKLEKLNIDSQLGMALYKGKIKLNEAFISLLDFSKGLIPTIVQDNNNQILMLAFSNKQSLKKTFATGKAYYYSRSRNKLWMKGETSSNFQEIINVRYDCDKDTLLFKVRQKNFACHTGNYSCFGEKKFGLEDLYKILLNRIKNPKQSSYTSKLTLNKLKKKIIEEANEVVNFKNRKNLVWEIADLTYFVLVLMAKNRIEIREIMNELEGRRR